MIYIIIVIYNNDDKIKKIIKNLYNATNKLLFQLILVDNASHNKVYDILSSENAQFADAIVFTSEKNLGYAGGNNIALRYCLDRVSEQDVLLILNPDVDLSTGSLAGLYNLLMKYPECAAISPNILDGDNFYLDRLRSLSWLNQSYKNITSKLASVDRLPGCCMMIRPSSLNSIGLLDENYFLYWEEIDWSLRALRKKYKLFIARDIVAKHKSNDENLKIYRIYYMWRNLFYFARKAYGPIWVLFLLRRLFLSNSREILSYWARGQKNCVRASLAGLWAGLHGEIGQSQNRYADVNWQQ